MDSRANEGPSNERRFEGTYEALRGRRCISASDETAGLGSKTAAMTSELDIQRERVKGAMRIFQNNHPAQITLAIVLRDARFE